MDKPVGFIQARLDPASSGECIAILLDGELEHALWTRGAQNWTTPSEARRQVDVRLLCDDAVAQQRTHCLGDAHAG